MDRSVAKKIFLITTVICSVFPGLLFLIFLLKIVSGLFAAPSWAELYREYDLSRDMVFLVLSALGTFVPPLVVYFLYDNARQKELTRESQPDSAKKVILDSPLSVEESQMKVDSSEPHHDVSSQSVQTSQLSASEEPSGKQTSSSRRADLSKVLAYSIATLVGIQLIAFLFTFALQQRYPDYSMLDGLSTVGFWYCLAIALVTAVKLRKWTIFMLGACCAVISSIPVLGVGGVIFFTAFCYWQLEAEKANPNRLKPVSQPASESVIDRPHEPPRRDSSIRESSPARAVTVVLAAFFVLVVALNFLKENRESKTGLPGSYDVMPRTKQQERPRTVPQPHDVAPTSQQHERARAVPESYDIAPRSQQQEQSRPVRTVPELNQCLLMAAKKGDYREVAMLLHEGAQVECRDSDGNTPLTLAAWGCSHQVVSHLLNLGADCNAATNRGNTALMHACMAGCRGVAGLLLEKGNMDLNHRNKHGMTALFFARKDSSLVEMLKAKGAEE